MGGSIALVLASRRRDLVVRLVLAEPNLGPSARPHIEPFTEATFVQFGFEQALTAVDPEWGATLRLADPVALYRTELALGRGTTPMMDELLFNLTVPWALIEGALTAELAEDPSIRASGIPLRVVSAGWALHDAGQSSGLRPRHHRGPRGPDLTTARGELLCASARHRQSHGSGPIPQVAGSEDLACLCQPE